VRAGAQREITMILEKMRTSSDEHDVIGSSEEVDEVDTSDTSSATTS